MNNEQLINRFYQAFQERDHQKMIDCYHPEIHFTDPVFDLNGKAAGAMWHMLCERGKDLKVVYSDVSADEKSGRAHWEADYTFGQTGRKVYNIIDASFEFQDGKIIRHRDTFDFWRWSRMALGPAGLLLGWSGVIRSKVVAGANKALSDFIDIHPQYQQDT